ncbi:hypothetical protein [Dermacoccus nishinomiyaensis]|uniref:hypothetical protein n=1 Tax=Dermacoccus nishinomiyaensis TaxID=1274 RepID=UPI001642CBF7|nr:hypothetical protein [Dermacoccus nishinomiyaensis]
MGMMDWGRLGLKRGKELVEMCAGRGVGMREVMMGKEVWWGREEEVGMAGEMEMN